MKQVKELQAKFVKWMKSLTQKEHILLAVACVFVLFWLSGIVYESVTGKLDKHEKTLKTELTKLKSVPEVIETNIKLRKRKAEVEEKLKGVELSQGGLAHLEQLIKTKAKISEKDFSIKPKSTRKISERFEQTPYSVKMEVTEYKNLLSFLRELVNGPKRMVLNTLNLTKSRNGQKLAVDLEVSSLKRIGS